MRRGRRRRGKKKSENMKWRKDKKKKKSRRQSRGRGGTGAKLPLIPRRHTMERPTMRRVEAGDLYYGNTQWGMTRIGDGREEIELKITGVAKRRLKGGG